MAPQVPQQAIGTARKKLEGTTSTLLIATFDS